jgi:hypothetical protein
MFSLVPAKAVFLKCYTVYVSLEMHFYVYYHVKYKKTEADIDLPWLNISHIPCIGPFPQKASAA